MEGTVKQRLINFLAHSKISQKAFADTCGLSGGFVNSIRTSIQPKTLNVISASYPKLNIGWLLTGDGKMLKDVVSSDVIQKPDIDYKEKYYATLEELLEVRRELDELKTEKLNQKDESPNAPGIVRSAEAS